MNNSLINKNKKATKYYFILIAFLLMFTIYKFGCKNDFTPKVVTQKVQSHNIIETVDETGKLYPISELKINADIGGLITEVYVQDGDTVHQGQAIAQIQTDATSYIAAKQNNPMQSLQKAMGQMNPEAIAQAMQQAQQPSTPTIKKETKYTTIYAPMSGIISEFTSKKGERLLSNQLAKINASNDWEVRADIGEVDIVKIKEGDTVNVKIDALYGKEFLGKVYRISNNNNSMNINLPIQNDITSYKVFIKINKNSLQNLNKNGTNYTLRTGMNTSIKITTNTKNNVLAIPLKAVTNRYINEENATSEINKKAKSEMVVFVVENGTAKKKVITTGIQDMDYIEVLSGLKENENLIIEPFEAIEKTLQNNMKIKIVNSNELFKKIV